jgi:hypothetical protein
MRVSQKTREAGIMTHRRTILTAMAAYYVLTGAWPLVHMRSFEAVTGRKTDRWLVHMVGALAIANGLALAAGSTRHEPRTETYVLAFGSIAAFSVVDTTFVLRGTIASVYLGDAAVEVLFGAALCIGSLAGHSSK